MKPLGSVEFSIEVLPDKLQIRYARHAGRIERIVAPSGSGLIHGDWMVLAETCPNCRRKWIDYSLDR